MKWITSKVTVFLVKEKSLLVSHWFLCSAAMKEKQLKVKTRGSSPLDLSNSDIQVA